MTNPNEFDTINIEGLEIDCVIGVNSWERLTKQRITVDIALDTDLSAAGKSDSLDDTIDYRTIAKAVTSEVRQSSYGLVEALAERVAEICLDDPRVQAVQVSLRKPGAIRNASAVGVTVRRSR